MQREKVTAAGGVVAAIGASVCCIGPLVAALLGAGSLAAASALQRWRPVFLGVTFVLLGASWYLTYRKRKVETCPEGVACPPERGVTANKVVLWVATAMGIALAGLPLYAAALARLVHGDEGTHATGAGVNVARLRVKIPSMDCEACAVGIQRTLAKQKGVDAAHVTFKTKEAVVEYDAARISPEKIVAAIDETGFKAETLTEEEKP